MPAPFTKRLLRCRADAEIRSLFPLRLQNHLLPGGEAQVRENVDFAYNNGRPVLQDISFTVEPGQTYALIGPTGSGKSTVTNLIPRFYDVTGGRITIDGIDIRDTTLSSLRAQIGIVSQKRREVPARDVALVHRQDRRRRQTTGYHRRRHR